MTKTGLTTSIRPHSRWSAANASSIVEPAPAQHTPGDRARARTPGVPARDPTDANLPTPGGGRWHEQPARTRGTGSTASRGAHHAVGQWQGPDARAAGDRGECMTAPIVPGSSGRRSRPKLDVRHLWTRPVADGDPG